MLLVDLQTHRSFFPRHTEVLNVEEYKQNSHKLEIRFCARHPNEPISLGCITCYGTHCTTCRDEMRGCFDGELLCSPHVVALLEAYFENIWRTKVLFLSAPKSLAPAEF